MTIADVPTHAIIDSLRPFAALPDWLAAAMQPGRLEEALRRQVPELADGRLQLVSCVPERLRAKGRDWLARYRLEVLDPGGAERTVVLVGKLHVPSLAEPRVPTEPVPDVPFGEPGWRCQLTDPCLDLVVQAVDEALPALSFLVDPDAARDLLERTLREAGYADASITSCEPRVARYKPGSRCTIVYRVAYADPVAARTLPDPVVVKTHEGVKGRVAWEAMRALWDTPLARGEVVTLAEPLAYLPDERVLVQGPVPEERTLKELAREAFDDGSPALLDELRIELAKTARALAALHGCGARYGRVATIEGELDEVREVIDRLAGSAPILAPAAAPLLNRLVELAATTPADPVTSAHHDFRPAQVLLHQGRIGFIDFDGSCTAEPALDLGRFRAKLRDTAISSLAAGGRPLAGSSLADNLALADELCEGFLDAYLLEAEVSRDRVLLWETCDLLTTMLHAWTKVRLARVGPRLAVLEHQLRSWPALHLPADTTSHE